MAKTIKEMSAEEIELLLKAKRDVEGIDLKVLEHFGIDPKRYDAEQLRYMTKVGLESIKDGRAILAGKYSIRTHVEYTLFLKDLKKTYGINGQQLMTAVIEAMLAGDLTVERVKIPKDQVAMYGGNKARVRLVGRHGIAVNPTNYRNRPEGVTL